MKSCSWFVRILGVSFILGGTLALTSPKTFAKQTEKPLALVWNGPGVCAIGCAKAAAKVARMAGFKTLYINPKNMAKAPFERASVWVQPGGKSSIAAKAMGPEFMEKIRAFVASGKGYVGYCAGMFISTVEIASRGERGFGFTPGRTELYLKDDPPMEYIKVQIGSGANPKWRTVYYAGGPFLHLSDSEAAAQGVEILSRYETGEVAAIHTRYGAGKVTVSGFHPEAAWFWGLGRLKLDRDGSDRAFAIKMMNLSRP